MMKHAVFNDIFDLPAPPKRVFPLLCPVREHDWIPTWQAEILFSRSGVAELDCVFSTDHPGEGTRTWVCTRYEPDHAISYTTFAPAGFVMRLDIVLEPLGDAGTKVSWSRRFIAINEAGNAWIDSQLPGASSSTKTLAKLLAHYLSTGTMLRELGTGN